MNRGVNKPSIEEIVRALEELKIRHQETGEIINKLIRDVETLREGRPKQSDAKPRPRKELKVSKEDCESLLGREVRIINPSQGEPDLGYIHSVGKVFVTVIIEGGVRKQRIAKNLRLIKYE